MNDRLIAGIVPNGSGEPLAAAARAAGAPGATVLPARGTAANGILQLLGLGETAKEVVVLAVPGPRAEAVLAAVRDFGARRRAHFGIAFSAPLSRFGAPGADANPDTAMQTATHQLVNVIVNKGYAEDVMAAARKAGARGGTVLGARGTAKPDDATFLGIPLVPEKEVLLVLVPDAAADAVLAAVRALPCLKEKGSGIAFALPVSDFTPIGG